MRVRSLHLRNFRRHADTRIEVPDGVTALLGANGSGKSSLLEGLAFALFGTDGLRTGKTLVRMDGAPPGDAVEATLELELGGQALTIHRELRGKALTPMASLVVDGAVVVPAGAGSSEAVTQQVARRLGMGPDAFFTAVVARQGELARLTNESPADRKRLVLRMVGVDRIDGAIDTVRERRRTAQAAVDALRRVAGDPAAAQARLLEAEQRVAACAAARDAAQAAWASAQEALAAATATLARNEEALRERQALAAAADLAAREANLRRDALARAEADLRLAAAAAREVAALAPVAASVPALQVRWQEAQQAVALARQRALAEQAMARLEAEHAAALAQEQRLPPPPTEDGIEAAEVALRMAEADVVAARSRLGAARTLLAQAQERRRRVAALGADGPCPTCERPIGSDLHTLVAHSHNAATHADDEVAAALAAEGQAAQRFEAVRTQRDRAAANQRLRERHALEAQALRARKADLEARIAEARAHLPPPVPAPAGIEQLRSELAAAQRAAEQRLRHLALAERVPDLEAAVLAAQQAHATAASAAETAQAALVARPDPTGLVLQARLALGAAQASERAAERAVHDAARALDAARSAAAQAAEALAAQQRVQAELAAAEAECRDWTALADNGRGLLERFRDHVVDRIGPAIQAEASRLLARFTGGRYSELLLDTGYNIHVTDGGVAYGIERFSGGEQDLAHLALRLAVSRLLAERAGGAELRFLALDEVFGSLDAQRRDHVVAALRSLDGLYSQVLVVSHQEALQEALDQALVVGTDETNRVLVRNG